MNRNQDKQDQQVKQGNKQADQTTQRGATADKDNLRQQSDASQQSGQRSGSQQQQRSGSQQSDSSKQGQRGGANRLSADEDMDDDTGLSNTANRQSAVDQGSHQASQSNVGRRDDGTPD